MTKTTRRKIEIAKLSVHPANVRKPESYSADGMEALKASIAALGLLQTPVVQALPGGSFGALIGGRRITALQGLREEGRIDYAFDVVLYTEFASRQALLDYAEHPEHLRVRLSLGDMRTARHQVDYEVGDDVVGHP